MTTHACSRADEHANPRTRSRRDRGVARDRRRRPRPAACNSLHQSCVVSGGRCHRHRARARVVLRCRTAAAVDSASARPARPAVPRAHRCAIGVLPAAARRRRRGDLALFGRVFPVGRRDRAGTAVLPIPRLPGGDGAGARCRRCVSVHGRLGVDGARFVLSRDERPSHSGNPPRGLPVSADRTRRRDRDPALLRRPPGGAATTRLEGCARSS